MSVEPSTLPSRVAETSAPILDVLAERWSPRAYDPAGEVSEHALRAALEAARWSPSAANTQPWRFIVGRRGDATFDAIFANLLPGNQKWGGSAGALIVNVAELRDEEGNTRVWGHYDLGQAVAHLSVQAHHDGLHVHQLGGIDAEGLREAFNIPERFEAVSVTVLGALGDADTLPDGLRERELAPRSRLPLGEIALPSGFQI
ncbi:nitroreductase family protein [Saxibacter everestensis]|uniref:Nitroreductase family protein n=1 Tax=Saxibacter everestensis TaxID=2909229 RepID=A0ABY8QQT2_9MICO|nr:nitroreductase family protein [Brevibacteriaceae bacterium ZFBP1038]